MLIGISGHSNPELSCIWIFCTAQHNVTGQSAKRDEFPCLVPSPKFSLFLSCRRRSSCSLQQACEGVTPHLGGSVVSLHFDTSISRSLYWRSSDPSRTGKFTQNVHSANCGS